MGGDILDLGESDHGAKRSTGLRVWLGRCGAEARAAPAVAFVLFALGGAVDAAGGWPGFELLGLAGVFVAHDGVEVVHVAADAEED